MSAEQKTQEAFKFNYSVSTANQIRSLDFDDSTSVDVQRDARPLCGEINPEAIDKLIYSEAGKKLINWDKVKVVVDWGMAGGKVLLQIHELCPQVKLLVGAEIVPKRYDQAVENLDNYCKYLKDDDIIVTKTDAGPNNILKQNITTMKLSDRLMIFSNNSMFDHKHHMSVADVIFMDVAMHTHMLPTLLEFVKEAPSGAVIISFMSLAELTTDANKVLMCHTYERMLTSWAPSTSHRFFYYTRI